MRQGHKRDAEIKALFDYSMWISQASKEHSDDVELAALQHIACLYTLQEMNIDMAEQKRPERNLVDDRLADCCDCDREGFRGCRDANGKYIGCKWFNSKNKVEFVRKKFGEKAIELLKKYPDVKRNGGRKT